VTTTSLWFPVSLLSLLFIACAQSILKELRIIP
jgi:hypothetical protein